MEKKRKTWHYQKYPMKHISENYTSRSHEKENVDFLNSSLKTFIKDSTSCEQVCNFDNGNVFPNSPIRRQINSLFQKSGRESQPLNLSTWDQSNKQKETFSLSEFQSLPLKELDTNNMFPIAEEESNFANDSLEVSAFEENCAIDTSTVVPQQNVSSETYTDTSLSDGVKIFDPFHKNIYFNNKPVDPWLLNSEDSKYESICNVTVEKMPICTSFNFNTNNFQSAPNPNNIKSVADELLEAGYVNKNTDSAFSSTHDFSAINVSPKIVLNAASCPLPKELKIEDISTCHEEPYILRSVDKCEFHDVKYFETYESDPITPDFKEPNLCFPYQKLDSSSVPWKDSHNVFINESLSCEIPVDFSSLPTVKEKSNIQPKKPNRRSPKSQSSKVKSKFALKGSEANTKTTCKIPDAKYLRGLPRRLTLRKEKLLEVCTRMLPTCCERLEESGGLHVIVTLIRSCNRSEPHKEIIIFCINILLNVAKYQKTMNSIWEQEKILETIVDLMRTYKDKTIPIFSKCCNLLWIFCQDPEKAQLLKNCKEFTNQIKILHNSVIRKFTVAQKSAKVPKTTCHNFSFDPRASLQIDPDWLLGKHRRREFKDSVVAISSLMLLLGLSTDNSISHTVKK